VIDMKPRGATGRLAGVGELASLLGVSRARAYTISRDFSFPAPFDVLNVGGGRPQAVWLMKDVKRLIEENRKY
jgi:predicted DNA-binding transcriptional regulator AlpA